MSLCQWRCREIVRTAVSGQSERVRWDGATGALATMMERERGTGVTSNEPGSR